MFHSARWDHDHDLAGERVAVIGTGASAVQIVPEIQRRVGALHLFQRTPVWVMPDADRPRDRLRARAVPARAGHSARRAGADLRPAGVDGARDDRRPAALDRVRAGRPPPPAPAGPRPGAAREAHPELHARLQADHDVEHLLPRRSRQPNAEVVTDPIAEVTERGDPHRRRPRARARHDRLGDRLPRLRPPRASRRVRGRGRQDPPGRVAGQPARLPRHRGRRLPEPLPPRRPEQRRRLQLDHLHQRGAHQLRRRAACARWTGPGSPPSRCAPRSTRPSPARPSAGSARASGTAAAARAGTSTQNGRNGIWWPGFTANLWRRTRRFDRGSYLAQPA